MITPQAEEKSIQMIRERTQMLMELSSKGVVKMKPKPNALQILDTPSDTDRNSKTYLMGMFGSGFGVFQVNYVTIISLASL